MTGVDAHLDAVRARFRRLTPEQAHTAARTGDAILVDTRPEDRRRTEGGIPGALVVERNHLEWRCDPASGGALPEATGTDLRWVVFCDEGYASSLAAQSLRTIGLRRATDMIGGFRAWRAAGLPVTAPTGPAVPVPGPGAAPPGAAAAPSGPA
ncbi:MULTISPECIES: rhodanese-like domain-containing protein [Streptomyces]|uniref:Sulfurtransferase n=1 Tax=Streptomyces lycii TaxID=2654337 RepID=A0ABQ7FB71_9ACTN|nr:MULTISPECIES: rhodanese-like domain-containing protein [Streptomyces]KAF4405584.1 sulfurtransferase [Streptomyces lycii]PGH50706.1 sulfurtransferase [Streptomyces sp. Ru87]